MNKGRAKRRDEKTEAKMKAKTCAQTDEVTDKESENRESSVLIRPERSEDLALLDHASSLPIPCEPMTLPSCSSSPSAAQPRTHSTLPQ